MRYTASITCFLALTLSACASLPLSTLPDVGALAAVEGATSALKETAQVDLTYRSQQATLNDIREAETRVDLARARLDFATVRKHGAENGDVREFLDARRSLRDVRNVYGPTDTGRPAWGYRAYDYRRDGYGTGWPHRRSGNWAGQARSGDPVGTFGLSAKTVPNTGQAMPLSGQSGN